MWRSSLSRVLILTICFSLSLIAAADEIAPPATITLIIDDLGLARVNGERALHLPGQLTFAILPNARYTSRLAQEARQLGREVILHMPMENVQNRPIGEGGLTHFQDRAEFTASLDGALARWPGAVGISNHMGSYLTQQGEQMSWVMETLKRRNLFFIDSRTTPLTLAADVARKNSVSEASRDVFLDNVLTYFEIDRQFQRLLRLARTRGHAIAIGHPHDETLDYLEMALPLLADQNVELVSASQVVYPSWSPMPRTMVAKKDATDSMAGGSQ